MLLSQFPHRVVVLPYLSSPFWKLHPVAITKNYSAANSKHQNCRGTGILWLPDEKNWITGKDPDSGKDWRQEKSTTEDEMVGGHHQLNGHEFEQDPRVGEGQGSMECCSHGIPKSWAGLSDWTELNWMVAEPYFNTVTLRFPEQYTWH